MSGKTKKVQAEVNNEEFIKINDDLYLQKNGGPDEERFTRLFNETWMAIDEKYRSELMAHWNHLRRILHASPAHFPTIEVTDCWEGMTHDDELSCVSQKVIRFHFRAEFISMLSDEYVKTHIATELARGYLLLTADYEDDGDLMRKSDELAQEWEFDVSSFGFWCLLNRRRVRRRLRTALEKLAA